MKLLDILCVHAEGGGGKTTGKSTKSTKSGGSSSSSSKSRGRTPNKPSTATRGRTSGGSAMSQLINSGQSSSTGKPITLYTGKTIMPGSVKRAGINKDRSVQYTAKDANGKTIKLDGRDMGALLVGGIDNSINNGMKAMGWKFFNKK